MEVNADSIPQELKDRHQWVLWKWETVNDKLTKVPYTTTGYGAGSTDPKTWNSFGAVLKTKGYNGIGFVVSADDPYCGIDLDKCIDDQGHFSDRATKIVDRFDSYTEITPSGHGLRIWIRGKKLPDSHCKKNFPGEGAIEIYDTGRFFTMTGDHVQRTQDDILDRQVELDKFYGELWPPESPAIITNSGTTPVMPDEEILKILKRAENSKKFIKLWAGEWTGDYGSWSEADLALCSVIEFYTMDPVQIDRIFRQSKLMRDKWDEKHGTLTYGQKTAQKVIDPAKPHYSPPPKRNNVRMAEVVEDPRYERRLNGIYYIQPRLKYTAKGVPIDNTLETQVCNFLFEIAREVTTNDGDEVDTRFDITGHAERPFALTVTSDELADPRRMVARLLATAGGKAIVYRGGDAHLRPALQSVSEDYEKEIFFVATGWYKIGDDWLYLTPGAKLARMEVPHEVKRYRVERNNDMLPTGYQTLRNILKVFPSKVSYISLAHAFLPPLYRWLNGTTRYMLHFTGETGTRKTSYALVLQGFYGDFSEPPEGWRSTVNHIETLGWHSKDALLLIDDYKPRYVRIQDFTQTVHHYSDGTARGRLNRDTTLRNSKPMRCVALSTGEDIPEGEASVLSRMIVLKMRNADIDLEALRAAQDNIISLPAVMADFLAWLPEGLEVNGKLERWRDEYATCFTGLQTNPGRIALNMAQNRFAWQVLGNYLIDRQVWTAEERRRYDDEYLLVSKDVIREMGQQVMEEKVSSIFLEALRAMLDSNEAGFWQAGSIKTEADFELDKSKKLILGWTDEEGYYLISTAAYHAVEKWLRNEGKSLGFSERAIWEQLEQAGILIQGKDRTAIVKFLHGKARRVMHLLPSALEIEPF